MKFVLVSLAVSLASLTAAAAPQQPDTVLGIKLGTQVAEIALPECPPKGRFAVHEQPLSALCLERSGHEHTATTLNLYGLPDIGLPFAASLRLFEGKVVGIDYDLRQADFEKMKALLVERYGPAAKTDSATLKASDGREVTAQTLQWVGERNVIVAMERFGTVGKSLVRFTNIELGLKQEQAAQAARR